MRKSPRKWHTVNGFSLIVLLIVCLRAGKSWCQSSTGQGYYVDQQVQWISVVTDTALINLFVEEYYLDGEEINKIEVYDLDNNGFSKGDVFKIYPDEMIQHLTDPSPRLQAVMNNWKWIPNFEILGDIERNKPSDLETREINKAGNAILAGFLRTLNRNYKDFPVKVWFFKDSKGMKFEMWGYNEDSLKYKPPPPVATIPDTVKTYDMLHLFQADTLVIADTTYYDFLYIYKSVSDTLFLPNKK